MSVRITLLDANQVPVEEHNAPGIAGRYIVAPVPLDLDGQVATVGVQVDVVGDDPRVVELLRELACVDEYVRRAALQPDNTAKLLGEINTRVAAFLKAWDTKPLGTLSN